MRVKKQKKRSKLRIQYKKIADTFTASDIVLSDELVAELKRKGLPIPVAAAFKECKKLKKYLDK